MRCPHCNTEIARVATESRGNNVEPGDVIIGKSLTVIKSSGMVEIKCPNCKAMIPIRRVPVFKVLVNQTGTIKTEE